MNCCLEADRFVSQAAACAGDTLVLTFSATRRAFGHCALQITCLHVCRRGELTEHTEELSDREADPEGQLKQRLFIMVVNKFTSVRPD